MDRVHPRVCGEATTPLRCLTRWAGPSPRVRGSPGQPAPRDAGRRSIPACAGKPRVRSRRTARLWVHPRVCGEARFRRQRRRRPSGPSPRVRGSRHRAPALDLFVGSIPACAGKPGATGTPRTDLRVHPRVCGEAPLPPVPDGMVRGPSPRVRGSPRPAASSRPSSRSIPACAGKPRRTQILNTMVRVHPRVCGEAVAAAMSAADATGPSPRVRGSRVAKTRPLAHRGSIPACAGKPAS